MKQVIQEVGSGKTRVRQIPDPIAAKKHVLVASVSSLVSAGTERSVVNLARKNLLQKARERPDQVRRVLQKVRQEGLVTTFQQVRAKLEEPMPLGYSSAGVVLECGEGVQQLKVGDRVATAGPHAELVMIGQNLCAKMPDNVSFEQAAYSAVASIGLEGFRLTRVTLGESVLVVGLGLIGQICVCLLKAAGCRVFGTDLDQAKLDKALSLGADEVALGAPAQSIVDFSRGHGVDAVLITAATTSNQPIELAAEVTRPKGRIVLVGVAGLEIPRPPFFKKELEFTVSASLGPGRWDPAYEQKGIDYPIGFARWTAQRNMQAILDLISAGKLPVETLTTHRFSIDQAKGAYDMITSGEQPYMGIIINYPEPPAERVRTVPLAPSSSLFSKRTSSNGDIGVSVVGAGNFARLIMLPILAKHGGIAWRYLCTARGMSAVYTGESKDFSFATTDFDEVLEDRDTDAVFIMTRHDQHGQMVARALRAGKHVFVEKPLCLTLEEFREIDAIVRELSEKDECPILMVGFNRRFAPATVKLRGFFAGQRPLTASFRFVTAELPADSWPQDEDVGGGRVIGEACHAIDTCTALVDSEPVRVYAEAVEQTGGLKLTDDRVTITLRHRDGSISNVMYVAGGDRAGPKERMEIFGGGRSGLCESFDTVELWKGGKVERARGGKDKGHAGEVEAFVHAVRIARRTPAGATTWPIPWPQLRAVSLASILAVRSLRQGCALSLDDEGALADEG